MHAASVVSFSPLVLPINITNGQVTITGLGLDVVSVRAVRFEPALNCTTTVANATVGTVNGTLVANVAGSGQTMLTVTQNATIAPGAYSVCVDFTGNPVSGLFVNVGQTQLSIGE